MGYIPQATHATRYTCNYLGTLTSEVSDLETLSGAAQSTRETARHPTAPPPQTNPAARSVNEIDTEEMQNQAPEDVIRKGPVIISTHSTAHTPPNQKAYLSCETAPTEPDSFPFAVAADLAPSFGTPLLVCMRRLAVRTNWPTAAQKPLRNALNGYTKTEQSTLANMLYQYMFTSPFPSGGEEWDRMAAAWDGVRKRTKLPARTQ